MSLRARLVVVLGAVCALALVLAGAATYELTRSTLIDRVDRQLVEIVGDRGEARLRRALEPRPPLPLRPRREVGADLVRSDVYFGLLDARGTLQVPDFAERVEDAQAAPRLPADLAARAAAEQDGVVLVTVDSADGAYRVAARSVGQGLTVVVGQPLSEVDSTLGRLLLILAGVGGGALLVAILVGLWLVRLGLRPLDRVAATADAITEGDLSHRVGDVGAPREIARVGRAMDTMLGRIETGFARQQATEARLRRFIADASHELRTPLTSIRGYAELFRRGAAERPDDLRAAMTRIEGESERMSALVDDMLLLARLDEHPELVAEPVDLAAVAEDVVAGARAAFPAHAFTLATDGPSVVPGDAVRLRQLVANLVRNVGVHTPAGSTGAVEVRGTAAGVEVVVADDGPGLPGDDPAELFGRFVRGDASRTLATGGTGLGLSIAEAVVKAHGGSLRAERSAAGGARLVAVLPAAPGAVVAQDVPGTF